MLDAEERFEKKIFTYDKLGHYHATLKSVSIYMTPTNTCMSCITESKLVEHQTFLVEFRVGQTCYILCGQKYSINLGFQQQWLKQ